MSDLSGYTAVPLTPIVDAYLKALDQKHLGVNMQRQEQAIRVLQSRTAHRRNHIAFLEREYQAHTDLIDAIYVAKAASPDIIASAAGIIECRRGIRQELRALGAEQAADRQGLRAMIRSERNQKGFNLLRELSTSFEKHHGVDLVTYLCTLPK